MRRVCASRPMPIRRAISAHAARSPSAAVPRRRATTACTWAAIERIWRPNDIDCRRSRPDLIQRPSSSNSALGSSDHRSSADASSRTCAARPPHSSPRGSRTSCRRRDRTGIEHMFSIQHSSTRQRFRKLMEQIRCNGRRSESAEDDPVRHRSPSTTPRLGRERLRG